MKYILQKSFVITALSLHRVQLHYAFFATLLLLLALLPATGKAGIGSGGSEVNFSCPESRDKCTCSGKADCELMRTTACAPGPLTCSMGSCSCIKKIVRAKIVRAAQSGTTAPLKKGTTVPTIPTAPAVPQAAPTTVVPKTMTSALHDTRKAVIQNFRALWLSPSRPSYQNARLVPHPPGWLGASMEVSCGGGKTYQISTGNNGGACRVTIGENGSVASGMCGSEGESGDGSASVSCSTGCTGVSGTGSCGEVRP